MKEARDSKVTWEAISFEDCLCTTDFGVGLIPKVSMLTSLDWWYSWNDETTHFIFRWPEVITLESITSFSREAVWGRQLSQSLNSVSFWTTGRKCSGSMLKSSAWKGKNTKDIIYKKWTVGRLKTKQSWNRRVVSTTFLPDWQPPLIFVWFLL